MLSFYLLVYESREEEGYLYTCLCERAERKKVIFFLSHEREQRKRRLSLYLLVREKELIGRSLSLYLLVYESREEEVYLSN